MKQLIVKALKWALDKLEPKPTLKEVLTTFPPVSEDFEPRPKTKPRVAKATTRTIKKPAVAAKTTRTKKAKQ